MYGAFPVEAAAYLDTDTRAALTHIVNLDTDRPLCSRVRAESVLLDYALQEDPETASCSACRRNYSKLKKEDR